MRRVTWTQRPQVDRFANRLGERLDVRVRLEVHRAARPIGPEGRDTVLHVVGPQPLAPFDVVSGDVLGAARRDPRRGTVARAAAP